MTELEDHSDSTDSKLAFSSNFLMGFMISSLISCSWDLPDTMKAYLFIASKLACFKLQLVSVIGMSCLSYFYRILAKMKLRTAMNLVQIAHLSFLKLSTVNLRTMNLYKFAGNLSLPSFMKDWGMFWGCELF